MTAAPKSLPVPHWRTLKPLSLQTVSKTPSGQVDRGRCYSENCFPWWLSVCLKCGWRPAGSLWRPLGLVCMCVSLTMCHVWPCVVCLQQYTFTVVFMAARQTSPESTVCLLSCFFFFGLASGHCCCSVHTQSFSFLLFLWVFNPLSDILKAANVCVSVGKQYSKSMHAHPNNQQNIKL